MVISLLKRFMPREPEIPANVAAQFDCEHKLNRAAELLPMREVRCTDCAGKHPIALMRASHRGLHCPPCFDGLFNH